MIREILGLAMLLPSGLPDPLATEKLLREKVEFARAVTRAERIEEAVDRLYYCVKEIHAAATDVGLSTHDLFRCAVAKYTLRARPGNPKEPEVERAAMMEVAGNGGSRELEWRARWSGGMKETAVLVRGTAVLSQRRFAEHVAHVRGGSERYRAEVEARDFVLLLYESGSGKTRTAQEVGGARFWEDWDAAERDLGLPRRSLEGGFCW